MYTNHCVNPYWMKFLFIVKTCWFLVFSNRLLVHYEQNVQQPSQSAFIAPKPSITNCCPAVNFSFAIYIYIFQSLYVMGFFASCFVTLLLFFSPKWNETTYFRMLFMNPWNLFRSGLIKIYFHLLQTPIAYWPVGWWPYLLIRVILIFYKNY